MGRVKVENWFAARWKKQQRPTSFSSFTIHKSSINADISLFVKLLLSFILFIHTHIYIYIYVCIFCCIFGCFWTSVVIFWTMRPLVGGTDRQQIERSQESEESHWKLSHQSKVSHLIGPPNHSSDAERGWATLSDAERLESTQIHSLTFNLFVHGSEAIAIVISH